MKKRSPADIDLFQHEESLIHKLGESNSAFIKSSAPFVTIPGFPRGNDKIEYAVGDLVTDINRSFYKTPMTWKVLKVTMQDGFASYLCELFLTPADLAKSVWKNKGDLRTETHHYSLSQKGEVRILT